MKVLLIEPATKTIYAQIYPRLSLAYLSGCLKSQEIEYSVLDLKLYWNWQKILKAKLEESYDFAGITSTTFEYKETKEIASFIKSFSPFTKIVVGGPHATLMRGELLKNDPNIDFCISGDGEYSFLDLINGSLYRRIAGLSWRENGEVFNNEEKEIEDLDKLPFPDYSRFELNRYNDILRSFRILTSRGCPFKCIYCTVGKIMGKKFRARTPEHVIKEIKMLSRKYGAKKFNFVDDNFSFDINRAKKICELMIKEKLHIFWTLGNGVRVDSLDEELVSLMKKSGCSLVAFGIESVDEGVLKNLRKGITLPQIEKALKLTKKYNILTKGFFLIGSPGGSKQEVERGFKFAVGKDLFDVSFSMLVPYPGTTLWDEVSKNNYWTVANPTEAVVNYTLIGKVKALYQMPGFTAKEKEEAYRWVWEEWVKHKRKRGLKVKIIEKIKKHPRLVKLLSKFFWLIRPTFTKWFYF